MANLGIGYLQRKNCKKRESRLMKSENGYSAHHWHTKSVKRPGH